MATSSKLYAVSMGCLVPYWIAFAADDALVMVVSAGAGLVALASSIVVGRRGY